MKITDLHKALRTVSAIPVTPFRQDGRADFAAYSRLVHDIVEEGVTVVTSNGNTGEFYALTPAEQRQAVEAALIGAEKQALVMAGVGFDVETAITMGKEAEQAGAQMLMVHQPVHPYQSAEGWVAYHKAIADTVPELGIVPYARDASLNSDTFRRLLDACPNLVGVKYAVPNPLLFASIVHDVGAERLTWICGLAEGWAPFFWVGGAQGFTSGLVNVRPRFSLEMLSCLKRNDYAGAMQIWAQIKPFEDLRARRNNANNVPVVKEALTQMGLCERTVRPPITALPESERAEVSAILANWGIAAR